MVARMLAAPTVAQRLACGERLSSFEFFPPKDEVGQAQLAKAIRELEPLHPDFVSVTYGASGSTRDRTLAVTRYINEQTSLETMGHLTCVSQSVDELRGAIRAYEDAGVRHILALRGDPPGGPTAPWVRHPEGLDNATQLVELVKETGDFCVGVAAFPDPHPERRDAGLDARVLAAKAQAGAEFAITQLFFEAEPYFALVERVRAIGCDIPIIPGIMPVTSFGQVKRFAELSGAELPSALVARLQTVAGDTVALASLGEEVATDLCESLLAGGAPGLHFFTQNRSRATTAIYARLKNRRRG